MLLTSLYVQNLQFISHKLHPSSSSHRQLQELVLFSSTKVLLFFLETSHYIICRTGNHSSLTDALVESLNKMHMNYIFHNKFRMIMPVSWIKKHFHQISIAVVCKVFLKMLQYLQETPVLESLFNKVKGPEFFNFIKRLQQLFFMWILQNFKNSYFEEYLQTAASIILIIKLVISIWHLFLIKNMMWDGFH